MKGQLQFSTILTILPLLGKLKDTEKGIILKLPNPDVPAQKGNTVNLFSSPIKVEVNVPITKVYQKPLTNTQCEMGKGAIVKRQWIQTRMGEGILGGLDHVTRDCDSSLQRLLRS